MIVSTGSPQSALTSTTLVSNSTRCVRSVLMPKKMAAVTALWITLSAMLPDSSTRMTTCHLSVCRRMRE